MAYLRVCGYLPEWDAHPNDPVDQATLTQWRQLSRQPLEKAEAGQITRLAVLQELYRRVK